MNYLSVLMINHQHSEPVFGKLIEQMDELVDEQGILSTLKNKECFINLFDLNLYCNSFGVKVPKNLEEFLAGSEAQGILLN